ncbi:MAG: adenylate kinase [Chloroflexi bacterium HGW-Chloroflexi-8]|nr:MAG: adenylate kinase [Chloroflexi bacterium HGW-Chloroflexi-8]
MNGSSYPAPGSGIVVIGATGSGKTTFSQDLSKILGYRVIELDAIHWLRNWQEADWDDIRSQVDSLTNEPGWVCDGNYRQVRMVLWPKADTVVWLNYPFLVVFARLLKRSLVRVFRKVELWNGNRERFDSLFLSKDSLFLWLIKSYPRHLKEYPLEFAKPEHRHLQVIRLTNPGQANAWLEAISKR